MVDVAVDSPVVVGPEAAVVAVDPTGSLVDNVVPPADVAGDELPELLHAPSASAAITKVAVVVCFTGLSVVRCAPLERGWVV